MDPNVPREAPAGWLEALARSDADLAAARTVPMATVLADLQASLDRMEARQAAEASSTIKA